MATKTSGPKGAPPQEAPKQRPAFEARMGRLKATDWRQESDKGPWYSTVITRSYKDDAGNWQSYQRFVRDDLLVEAKLCDQVHSWIWWELAKQQRGRQPGEEDEVVPF